MRARRAVPRDDTHTDAMCDSCHVGGDRAEPDEAERAAAELNAFAAHPRSLANLAVHPREVTRPGPRERDCAFGHRRITVALDRMHGDAELRERFRAHVAARAGPEEDDVT